MAAPRGLLEAFKFLKLFEITKGVDLVCKHWKATAEKAELWAFLLEQELLVNRLSPMCQQDYPTLAASYISSRASFIEFWRGAKRPEFLLFNTPEITVLTFPSRINVKTSLVFEEGFRAVSTGRGSIIVTGVRRGESYAVVEYDVKRKTVTPLPCCIVKRLYHAIAADADNIYLSGGMTEKSSLRSAEVYSSHEWRALPDMNFQASNHTMVLINTRLFTFGGNHDKAELFDTVEWRNLDLFLPWALADFGVAVTSFKQVLLIGGETTMNYGHYIYSLDLMTGEVAKLAKTAPFRCYQNAVCIDKQEVVTVEPDGRVVTYKCPLLLKVTVKFVYENVLLKANLKVKPGNTVGMVIQKFKEVVSKTKHLELILLVEGHFYDDDMSVVAANIVDGCQAKAAGEAHIELLKSLLKIEYQVKIMNPSLCRSPKIFKSSRNDLRSIISPQKNSTLASRRPAKLSSLPAPPPGEEWDVDDEEAMASPLFSVTPHSNKRLEENAVFSPFAPAIPRSPNQMQTNIKSEKYLSSKEASVTSQSLQHRPSHSAMAVSPTPPSRRQGPALRHLRPNSSRIAAPNSRTVFVVSRDKSWDEMVAAGLLKVVLPFCSICAVTALMKVSKKTRVAREVKRRFRETIMIGLDGLARYRLWTNVTLYTRKDDSAKRYFHPAVHCPQDIRNDISRTPSLVPGQQLTHKQQISMMRLLDAVALYNCDVGYCQGMNYIAALLVQVVDSEEDCFWLMNSLMTRYKLKKLLKPGLSQLKLLCFQLDCLLQHYLPKVYSRMKTLEISTEVYAAKWFITLLSYELPRHLLEKVWDLFFLQGWKVIFRVILALLSISKEELIAADSMALTGVLNSLSKSGKGDETLLKTAFSFKVTRRILKDLKRLRLLKCKGVYQLIPGKNRKLEWLVTPSSPHCAPTTEASDDSNLASRILSKVMYLFKKGEPEPENEEDNLDSTICLDELPVPMQVQNTVVDDLLAAVPIKDLDSGKVIYVHPDEDLCCICGSTSHSSRYCTQDKNGALWVFPKAHHEA